MKIEFIADRVMIRERESDNSYKVQFSTGEYAKREMAKLLLLPKDVEIKVIVEVQSE